MKLRGVFAALTLILMQICLAHPLVGRDSEPELPWVYFAFDQEQIGAETASVLGRIETQGCLLVPGVSGRALQFDGQRGYLRASAEQFPIKYGGTLSLWVALNQDLGDDRQHTFFSMSRGSTDVVKLSTVDRNGGLAVRFSWTGNKTERIVDAGIEWLAGEWHHLACTWTVGGKAILYVDGLEAGHVHGIPALSQSPESFELGRDTVSGTTAGCALDEVAIFSKVLTRREIRQLAARAAEEREQKVRRRLADVPEDFTFAIVSDIHMQSVLTDEIGLKLKRAVEMINKIEPAFVVLLGDLTDFGHMYDEPAAAGYLAFSVVASGLKPVIVPVVGNHDAGSQDPEDPSRILFQDMAARLETFSRTYYSFECGRWHFVVLDTGWDGTIWKKQLDWLEEDIAKHSGAPTVCFMHIHMTPIGEQWLDEENCTIFARTADRQRLFRILKDGSVKWVFNGHTHPTLERSHEKRVRVGDIHFVHVPAVSRPLVGGGDIGTGFLLVHVEDDKVAGTEFVSMSGEVFPEPAPDTYQRFSSIITIEVPEGNPVLDLAP